MSRNTDRPVSSLPVLRYSKIVNSSCILEAQRNPSSRSLALARDYPLRTATRTSARIRSVARPTPWASQHRSRVILPGVGGCLPAPACHRRETGALENQANHATVSTTVKQRDGEFFILGWEKWLKLKLTKRFSRNETGKQTFEIRCVENWRCTAGTVLNTRFTGWPAFLRVWLLVQCV